jgi:hypothetical protein
MCSLPASAGADPGGQLRTRTAETPIVGGRSTDPGEFDAVVAISVADKLCTGLMVSPRVAVTAAHCLAGRSPSTSVRVVTGSNLGQDSGVPATRWATYPDFCADCPGPRYDYAFVEVESAISFQESVLPVATQAEWDDAMFEGNEVTLVGYGGDQPDGTGSGRKRSVVTEINGQSSDGLEFRAGADGRDSCDGDSGGPAFVVLPDGQRRWAGITSRGSTPCGQGGYYAVPYAALCWLHEETGVDLRRDACGACDCLDMAPSDAGACRLVASEPPLRLMLPLFLVLVVWGRRRR